jgi:hypothetical protein
MLFTATRQYEISSKVVPTITWKPCRPVNIKNTEPYKPSLIVNLVSPYSKNCNHEKKIPKEIAIYIILINTVLCPIIIARCALTKATPEQSRTIVLTRGSIKGSRVSRALIPTGGQIAPKAIDGDSAPWKNAQKNGKNSIASDTKNNNIPYFKPVWTCTV